MIVEFVANALLVSILFILLGWSIVLSLAYIGTKHAHERQIAWIQARMECLSRRLDAMQDSDDEQIRREVIAAQKTVNQCGRE